VDGGVVRTTREESIVKALVVYESMFGNTRQIAQRVAEGLRPELDASVVPVAMMSPKVADDVDVIVVGGPTHVHGMASKRTRQMAKATAEKEGSGLTLEPDALSVGLREWLDTLSIRSGVLAAAFDTRARGPAFFTGRANRRIARRLRRRGVRVLETKSFLVDKTNRLIEGESERAAAWGASLASLVGQPSIKA
jgi:flavodoxin